MYIYIYIYIYILYSSCSYTFSFHVAPPEITAEPNQYVVKGNNATLICNFTGQPIPEVIWRRNGSVIRNKETMKYSIPDKGLLKVVNTTEEDAGIYKCTATNNRGSDERVITLTVLSKLLLLLYTVNVEIFAGLKFYIFHGFQG